MWILCSYCMYFFSLNNIYFDFLSAFLATSKPGTQE